MSATQNTVYNVTPSLLVVAMDSQALLDKFVGTIVSTHEGEPDPSAPEFPALTVLSAVNVSLKAALSTIVNLARSFELDVIAGGVDSQEQLRILRLLRCQQIQGFLFHKPMPEEAFAAVLRGEGGGDA